MSYIRQNLISFVVLLIAMGTTALQYANLPESFAIHFDFSGEPDRFVHKAWGAFLLPIIGIAVVAMMPVFRKFSPRGYRVDDSIKSLGRANLAIAVMMMLLQFGVLAFNLSGDYLLFAKYTSGGIGLFLVIFGNYIAKVQKNFFIGIRTPWALTSDENWRGTHRFAGKACVVGGVLCLLSLKTSQPLQYSVAILIISFLLPALYSFVLFRREERA